MLEDLIGYGEIANPEVGIDPAALEAGLDEIRSWINGNCQGVLVELLRAYIGGTSSTAGAGDLISEASLGSEMSTPEEGDLLRFILPWVVSRAIRDARDRESECLADEARAALKEGDRDLAAERWAESQNLLIQFRRWDATSDRAYDRMREFLEVAFVPRGSICRN